MNDLYGVVIGAVAALAGTALSQSLGLVSGWIDRRYERDKRDREKLEELSDSISASLEWLRTTLPQSRSKEELYANLPPQSARRAVTIAILYFPELTDIVGDYSNSLVRHYQLVVRCYNPDIPVNAGAQVELMIDEHPELRNQQFEPVAARTKLEKAIAEAAKRLRHA